MWRDYVVVCGVSGLYVVSTLNGYISRHIQSRIGDTSASIVDDMAYWVSGDSYLNAVHLPTGTHSWRYRLDDYSGVTPTADSARIYCAGRHYLYALNALSGNIEWSWNFNDVDAVPCAHVAVDAGVVYLTTKRLGLVAVEAATGHILWQMIPPTIPALLDTAPCIAPDAIYVAGGNLYAVDRTQGRICWYADRKATNHPYALTKSTPICVGAYIYIGGGRLSDIYAFERATGRQVWEFHTTDFVFSTPAYAHGYLVIGSHDGNVYCLASTS